MVTSTVRRKKKLYYDSKITDCQSNPKQLWNVIGQLTGRKQFDNIPADLSANDFNEYFSRIGSETVAQGRDRFDSSGRGIGSAGSRIVAHETIDQTETGTRWLTMFTFLRLQLK